MQDGGLPVASSLTPVSTPVPLSDVPAQPVAITSESTAHTDQLNKKTRITTRAREYAGAELARRAGVPFEVFRTWKVVWTDREMIYEIPGPIPKRISFPLASPRLMERLRQGQGSAVHAKWMGANKPPLVEEDLTVPFVNNDSVSGHPLFRLVDGNHVECLLDLPLTTLLTLCRWEETLDSSSDVHDRFVTSQGIAARNGFLDRPIVDEYGLALEQALQALIPIWSRSQRVGRVKFSMDVDHVGIPFNWKHALRHTTHYRTPVDSGRDLLGWLCKTETPNIRAVREAIELSMDSGLNTAVYWKASPPGPRDSGYDPLDPRVRQVIDSLLRSGIECGVHPGYMTFRSPERLRREIAVLREVLGDGPVGGRQHYLRWCPDTWIHWERCGLSYDSSVGFHDHIGFRAGTCIPYRPWLLSLNRRADLLEIPLIAMDRSLLAYMRLTPEDALSVLTQCLARCRAVGGVFSTLWHNDALLDPAYRAVYLELLSMCSGLENYDWCADDWERASA